MIIDGAVVQEVHIDARPETVWWFWVDPKLLCTWWGVDADVVAEPGGRFRVEMEGGPIMLGEFVELDFPNRVVFTFGWDNEGVREFVPPGSSRVEVDLRPDADGTWLALRHTGLPLDACRDHEEGWTLFVLDRLVEIAKQAS